MAGTMRRAIWTIAAVCVLLGVGRVGFAEDAPTVHVNFPQGETELAVVREGTKFFSDKDYPLLEIPSVILGLSFTRRATARSTTVNVDASAGSTVYVLVDTDNDRFKGPARTKTNADLASSGWKRISDTAYIGSSNRPHLALYERQFEASAHYQLTVGNDGIVVIAKSLSVDSSSDSKADKPNEPTPTSTVRNGRTDDDKPVLGPTTRPSMLQTSIQCLGIRELDSGLMLGRTLEVTLTLTPGEKAKRIELYFGTPVGSDMILAGRDALRYIQVTYPNWYVDQAVLTFEDKYNPHDGGSIATGIATMTMSVIQGIHIDPHVAITGDIGANGHVQPVGGVAAKIRGAIAGKCNLVALPLENEDQLNDAVVYSGPEMLSDIQVIGISSLEDAIATVRIDRSPALSQALELFEQVEASIKADPKYLKTPAAKDMLTQVLELQPQHLSAKLLLATAQGKQPKTLSATATQYYTALAAHNMLTILNERFDTREKQTVTPGVVRAGLADLHKLQPIANENVKPLITAWMRFIETYNGVTQGSDTLKNYETQRQALLDEMTREDTNPDLMQKQLKESM